MTTSVLPKGAGALTMKASSWTDPVYDVGYCVAVGPFDELEAFVFRRLGAGYALGVPASGQPPHGRTVISPGAQDIVFWFPNNDPDAGTLAHEAVHAAVSVLWDRGVKLKPAAEEALTYYVGYIVRQITRRLDGK